ncbi:MAG: sugar ABC transporter permease [Deinococcales bacterium]
MIKARFSGSRFRDILTGYLFISPALIIIALFGVFPIIYAAYMSLHRWRVRQGNFLGLANYEAILGDFRAALVFFAALVMLLIAYWLYAEAFKGSKQRLGFKILAVLLSLGAFYSASRAWKQMMASGDDDFLESLIHTLYYALGTVPSQIALGLLIAYLLFQNLPGKEWFRVLFFLPYITPVVAAATVFRGMFSERMSSLANQALTLIGLEPQKWLAESRSLPELLFGLNLNGFWEGPSLALLTIMIFGIWTYAGYNAVILLAGLSGIPKNLYEAAEIDGANAWQSFKNITFPLLSPVIFYLAITGFIGTFQAFNHLFVMRNDFARGTVDVASIAIFDSFYKANKFGYASAEAIILFFIILLLTIAQFTIFNRRVFYG